MRLTHNILLIIAATLLLLQTGCVKRDMADVNRSMKAEEIITGWPLPDEYEYYYYGRDITPIAFLALHKDFTIESKFWTKISPTEKMKEFWREEFKMKLLHSTTEFRGSEITTSDGKHVGMMYSRYYWITAWPEEPGSNKMVIPPPELAPNQERPGQDWRSDDN